MTFSKAKLEVFKNCTTLAQFETGLKKLEDMKPFDPEPVLISETAPEEEWPIYKEEHVYEYNRFVAVVTYVD